MALGGGTFLTQNKVLPGAYINFISKSRATATLSDRGYAALADAFDWGPEGEIITAEPGDFQKDSLKIFGYDYSHEKLKGLRDFFMNIKAGYLFNLRSGGLRASCEFAKALYPGIRGNDLKVVIEYNEESTEEDIIYDVSTYFDGLRVDTQSVRAAGELKDNDYLSFISGAALEETAGTALTGGTNGDILNSAYQSFIDKIESYSFNTIGCLSGDNAVKGLFAAFTKRMRDDCGAKFQCVLHRYAKADYEGVISVENNETPELVYWMTGASAGCAVNQSNTNKIYDGEFEAAADYTQSQLTAGIRAGKLMFHKVDRDIRVLEDINTFVSFTDNKNEDFGSNQTIRVLDQIANDIAVVFNTKYLGKVPNDGAGRIALWNDIVKHHQELETIRAIEGFAAEDVTVEKGNSKKAVAVTDYVTPVNCMSRLYMTVIVE